MQSESIDAEFVIATNSDDPTQIKNERDQKPGSATLRQTTLSTSGFQRNGTTRSETPLFRAETPASDRRPSTSAPNGHGRLPSTQAEEPQGDITLMDDEDDELFVQAEIAASQAHPNGSAWNIQD